jgi:hypothetical protein
VFAGGVMSGVLAVGAGARGSAGISAYAGSACLAFARSTRFVFFERSVENRPPMSIQRAAFV